MYTALSVVREELSVLRCIIDVFGKSPHSRYDRSERDDSETWEYYCQLQQEIDEILNSAFKEWDQWEIECTDYSSIRRSRGRGWKTR
ncbi:hypothetical protein Bca101_062215 [Brassica carinata]